MTDAPERIWCFQKYTSWDELIATPGPINPADHNIEMVKYIHADIPRKLEVEIDAVQTTLKMVEQVNNRLRGIIAEMVMYDWSGVPQCYQRREPPNNLRKDVAEIIGFPTNKEPDS